MNQFDSIAHDEAHVQHIAEHLAQSLAMWAVWSVLVLAFIAFVKIYYGKRVSLWLDGRFWHAHRNFDFDDPVIVDGTLSRMVRATTTDTVFYQYTVDKDGRVIFADKLPVANDKLKDLKITKQLSNHHRPDMLRPVNE